MFSSVGEIMEVELAVAFPDLVSGKLRIVIETGKPPELLIARDESRRENFSKERTQKSVSESCRGFIVDRGMFREKKVKSLRA